MTEYATFNDPPERPKKKGRRQKLVDKFYGTSDKAEQDRIDADFQAAFDKPWSENTRDERIAKGLFYGASAAVGAVGAALTYMATHSGGSSGGGGSTLPPLPTAKEDFQRRLEEMRVPQQATYHPVHLTHLDHLGHTHPGWLPTGQSGSWW